jgi:hypothetical protein
MAKNEPGELDNLDMIALEAASGEQDAQAAVDAVLNPEPAIDPAQAWAQIPAALGGLLGMAMPELRAAYTESACMAWGQGMAQVSDKYGWDAGETISKWTPEFMLIAATIPLLIPTVRAIQLRREAKPEEPKKEIGQVEVRSVVDLNLPDLPAPGGFVEPS